MFLKSHRKWTSPDLKESDVVAFWDGCIGAGIDPKRFVKNLRLVSLSIAGCGTRTWTPENYCSFGSQPNQCALSTDHMGLGFRSYTSQVT